TETSEFYKVKVSAGQKLSFEVLARRIGSPLDPIVVLHDAKTRRELVDLYADDTPGLQGDCRLAHTFKDAGEVLVEVRDTTHRGGGDFYYRLRIGDFPGATTAFPLAAEHGKDATIGFAGPETIPPVKLTAPKDVATVYAVPSGGKDAGWPVPVLLTEYPQITEQEPNDTPAQANKLPVPGGASGRFDKAKDVDHFAVTAKKGQKLAVSVSTFEVNSPAEVFVQVLDAKGAVVAKNNPSAPTNRFEFTPPADGNYVVACEHQNFLHGPNEVYLLTVVPVEPDFNVALALDRADAPAGGSTAVMATVTRLNGFAGPVELSIDGDAALSGKTTLAAGQAIAFVPLLVKEGTKPGAHPFRVKATAPVGSGTVTRYGTLTDAVKAGLGGMPNPPVELLTQCAVGVTDKPPVAIKLTFEPPAVEKGKTGKVLLEATRGTGADADIALAPLFTPPGVVAAVKPIAKGQTKGEIGLTVQPAAPVGPNALVFRATTKVGGKDFAYLLVGTLDVADPKKTDPKKEEPKKKDKK
ncbi:MAG TPA: PPC domain-containing protein, partial [Gemmata sp.]